MTAAHLDVDAGSRGWRHGERGGGEHYSGGDNSDELRHLGPPCGDQSTTLGPRRFRLVLVQNPARQRLARALCG